MYHLPSPRNCLLYKQVVHCDLFLNDAAVFSIRDAEGRDKGQVDNFLFGEGAGQFFTTLATAANGDFSRLRQDIVKFGGVSYLYRKRLILIFGVFSKGSSTVSILVSLL